MIRLEATNRMEMPMCAICGKVVDKMTLHDDINAYRKTFTVFCHGDRQEAVIEDWMAIEGKVEMGVAFDQRRVGNAPT